jgi:hypothetical protein
VDTSHVMQITNQNSVSLKQQNIWHVLFIKRSPTFAIHGESLSVPAPTLDVESYRLFAA